jgi:hypothetical protein
LGVEERAGVADPERVGARQESESLRLLGKDHFAVSNKHRLKPVPPGIYGLWWNRL